MGNPYTVVDARDPGRELAFVDDRGNGEFDGDLTVGGILRALGGIDAALSLTSLLVSGNGVITGDLGVGDDLTVTDDLTVGGDAAITGTLTVGGQPITPGGGGGVALAPVTGRYSVAPGFGRASGPNLALGTGNMVGVMFEVAAAATIDRFGTDVAVAGGAGGLLRGVLYATVSATDTRPGAVIADYGTIASDDGTGAHLWTVSQAVVPGTKYIFAVAVQVAGCTLRTTETYDPRVTVSGTAGWIGTVATGAYSKAGVTGAPPDPWGATVDEVPIRVAIRWA